MKSDTVLGAPNGASPATTTDSLITQTTAALDQLAEALDRGESPQLQRFLAAMGRFHRYSPRNLLLILGQRPDATHVAGFHTWRKLGRPVRKGERGIRILAPVTHRKPADDDDEDERVIRFRAVTVFDIAQTDGESLPQASTTVGEPGGWVHALESAIRHADIVIETVQDLDGAEGVSFGGLVQVLASLSPARRFSVLAHEWAHELLHKVDPASRPSRAVRETEAEAVAFVVCSSIGLETASSDYIRLCNGDREALLGSLGRIQRAACTIIEAMREQAEDHQSLSESVVRSSVHTGAASSVCTERTASSGDEKMTSNKPLWKIRSGGVQATAWNNATRSPSGEQIERVRVTINRHYRDANGEWKTSGSLSLSDLMEAHELVRRAIERLVQDKEGEAA